MVIAHMGLGGHRGYDSTVEVIVSRFHWTQLRADVASFISECLHCLVSKGPHRIPRPLGSAVHGAKPNQVVHVDFFDMGKPPRHASHNWRYILLLQDDLSKFCELIPAESATAEVMATAFVQWCTRYGSNSRFLLEVSQHRSRLQLS
uniref:Integrase zinc-binding domain-containing protein n=1 Tax=Spongospora subterranea TaxID=70186 RepID=A0A0H5RFR5_9EUKA|eukprot:CRZ07494.1 hypothetical protein [Spongospora subterranea]